MTMLDLPQANTLTFPDPQAAQAALTALLARRAEFMDDTGEDRVLAQVADLRNQASAALFVGDNSKATKLARRASLLDIELPIRAEAIATLDAQIADARRELALAEVGATFRAWADRERTIAVLARRASGPREELARVFDLPVEAVPLPSLYHNQIGSLVRLQRGAEDRARSYADRYHPGDPDRLDRIMVAGRTLVEAAQSSDAE